MIAVMTTKWAKNIVDSNNPGYNSEQKILLKVTIARNMVALIVKI